VWPRGVNFIPEGVRGEDRAPRWGEHTHSTRIECDRTLAEIGLVGYFDTRLGVTACEQYFRARPSGRHNGDSLPAFAEAKRSKHAAAEIQRREEQRNELQLNASEGTS